MENRIGKFKIKMQFLSQRPHLARFIFSKMVILRAEYNDRTNEVEYLASSHLFENLKIANNPPTYRIDVDLYGRAIKAVPVDENRTLDSEVEVVC